MSSRRDNVIVIKSKPSPRGEVKDRAHSQVSCSVINIKASPWGRISVSHPTSLILEIAPVSFCLFFLPPFLSFASSSQLTRVKRYSFSVHSGKSFRNVAENKIVQIRRFESQKIATVLSGGGVDDAGFALHIMK